MATHWLAGVEENTCFGGLILEPQTGDIHRVMWKQRDCAGRVDWQGDCVSKPVLLNEPLLCKSDLVKDTKVISVVPI